MFSHNSSSAQSRVARKIATQVTTQDITTQGVTTQDVAARSGMSQGGAAQDTIVQNRLIHFLRHDMAVSDEAIALALKRTDTPGNLLPMVLWQYGIITLEQLDQVFDWMEAA